jgi:hypothetical protein
MPGNTMLAQTISEHKTTYTTIIARLEDASHSSLSAFEDLKKFASNLQKQCNNTVHLTEFRPLATDIKNGIFQYVRDMADFAKLDAQMASFRDFYMDKERWHRKNGSMDGWQKYMDGLKYPRDQETELRRLRRGVRWITELEKLWGSVQLEDAKAQHQAHEDAVLVR